MIYKDKNTRLQTSKHEESREDTFYYARRYNERNDRRKNNRYILNFRITIPLIYRFWFDSLIDDDKLMIIYSTGYDRGGTIKSKSKFEELMLVYPGDTAKIRELKLNHIL
jgi:hypothetical protein